ncbi:hypothetical protein MTR_7g113005 [Medicago truncatula]|uniref:Uncharacterized protein n=1 Tax=Medicago truncatula TaxID=3880 RepID=A2Q316_MEDTR|nr:hypothetical protein MtrDRAFT_AC154391g1v2 [Medicago truncatula]KEH24511.1 hypothetical protein MTR_7g113005 [Medicago truncatula]
MSRAGLAHFYSRVSWARAGLGRPGPFDTSRFTTTTKKLLRKSVITFMILSRSIDLINSILKQLFTMSFLKSSFAAIYITCGIL